jgi:methionyl-tRNA formyltransferase
LNELGIILTPGNRSKAYLSILLKNKIDIDKIIFMNNGNEKIEYAPQEIEMGKNLGFDISKSVKQILIENKLNYTEFPFVDINNKDLIQFVKTSPIKYFIFTGGGILKNEILNCGSKFIHIHPGWVPNYKGSTCFYYSILQENYVGVTAFLMDVLLDTGDIIHQKKFTKPDTIYLDNIYDPYIRAETLLELLKLKLLKNNSFTKQNPNEGETFFVIHPVLKHIAILDCEKPKN